MRNLLKAVLRRRLPSLISPSHMEYWIAVVCLLVDGAFVWYASRKLSLADQAKLDAPAERKSPWRWIWLPVGLAYPFLSNLMRALVLCGALLAMAIWALQRWMQLARMGMPRPYLRCRALGDVFGFAGAAIVCWALVREVLAQKS